MNEFEEPISIWLGPKLIDGVFIGDLLDDGLRHIFGRVEYFTDTQSLYQFFKESIKRCYYDQIFLVTTVDYLDDVLSDAIHDIRSIEAIFIYDRTEKCKTKNINEFYKVEGIFRNSNELLVHLSKSVDLFSRRNGILISAMKQYNPEMTAKMINNIGDYAEVWYPLFLDLIFDLPQPSAAELEGKLVRFVDQCKRIFRQDSFKMKQLDIFLHKSQGYQSRSALKYYTIDSFLYKVINRGLRQQNLQAILYFDFFLNAMKRELQTEYELFATLYEIGDQMKFYRGQKMFREEIEFLKEKRRQGSLITTNSYFSTTMCRNTAIMFASSRPNPHFMPVLFDVTAEFRDLSIKQRKPFAYIGCQSHFGPEELEVLFSMGSFFRIDNIQYDSTESITTIYVTFIYDDDEYTITHDYSALKSCTIEQKLIRTGSLLCNHSTDGYFRAEAFYQRIIDEYHEINIRAACQAGLGWIYFKKKQYEMCIAKQEEALKIYETTTISNYLYITSYTCIGVAYRQMKQYSKAMEYLMKADRIDSSLIPIDKYAFYEDFNEIAPINIACIHKIRGSIDTAWAFYKKILSTLMKNSESFHAATFLKIAEAGCHKDLDCLNDVERLNFIDTWKRFLDHSLTDMSSVYRRSIVSGILSIGFQLGDSYHTRDILISYYTDIIKISHRFMKCATTDYHIVLQCYQQIAILYRAKRCFLQSINSATDGLKLCLVNDLDSIATFYEILAKTYETSIENDFKRTDSRDIDSKIYSIFIDGNSALNVDEENKSLQPSIEPVLKFARNEFSFGQYKIELNANLSKENQPKRCLAYCLLKLAAVRHELKQTAHLQELLGQVHCLLPNENEVNAICENNIAYLSDDFSSISARYETELTERSRNSTKSCIGEDAFSYIAHLNEKQGQIESAQVWHRKSIEYFRDHRLFCIHTRACFDYCAAFQQRHENLQCCIKTYEDFLDHVLSYRVKLPAFLNTIITQIKQDLTKWANENDRIYFLQHLIKIAYMNQDSNQFLKKVDDQIKLIIGKFRTTKNSSWKPVRFYRFYLENLLSFNPTWKATLLEAFLSVCHSIVDSFKASDDPETSINVYQRFIGTILTHRNDRYFLIDLFKQYCLLLEEKQKFQTAIEVYIFLNEIKYLHPGGKLFIDYNNMVYIICRLQAIGNLFENMQSSIYKTIIDMMVSFRNLHSDILETEEFLDEMKIYNFRLARFNESVAINCYSDILELFYELRVEKFSETLNDLFEQIKTEQIGNLIPLLKKYQPDFTTAIMKVHEKLSKLSNNELELEPIKFENMTFFELILKGFNERATRLTKQTNSLGRLIQWWTECIQILLEHCLKYDEYFAKCYIQLGDHSQVKNIFHPFVYETVAIKFSPDVYRYYLKYKHP